MILQSISRAIFLFFILVLSVYFLRVNKEHFVDDSATVQSTFQIDAATPSQQSVQGLVDKAPDSIKIPVLPKEDALVPDDYNVVKKIVQDTYKTLFKRFPTTDEIGFYYDYVKNRQMTRSQFEDIIGGSADTLAKTLPASTSSLSSIYYGTEDDVVVIYNEILMRNPDDEELAKYSKMLATDATFTPEKLRQLLLGFPEYKRLEMTQTNETNSGLIGGLTDRQLSYMVNTYYYDVLKKDDLDEETLKYLKKKFIDFNLNEDRFKQFLRVIYDLDAGSCVVSAVAAPTTTSVVVPPVVAETVTSTVTTATPVVAETYTTVSTPVVTTQEIYTPVVKQEVLTSPVITPTPPVITYTQPTPIQVAAEASTTTIPLDTHHVDQNAQNYYDHPNIVNVYANGGGTGPNGQIIEELLKKIQMNDDGTYLSSDKVIDTLKNPKKPSCGLQNPVLNNGQKGGQSTADLIKDRNSEELKNTCIRNKKFGNVDDDLVLDKSFRWSVPQQYRPVCQGTFDNYQPVTEQTGLIGTLLDSAKDTMVGSMLPLYPPK